MSQRRSLMEGLKQFSPDVDPAAAEDFINNGTPRSAARPSERKEPAPAATASPAAPVAAPAAAMEQPETKDEESHHMGRAPLTIRFPSHFAKALKNASLDRQMKGIKPYKLQDILEQAVEPWLRSNGYLN
jgi:hypothetical protein